MGLGLKKFLNWIGSPRTATVLTAFAAIAALYFSGKSLQATQSQLGLSEQGQIADRFTKSVEQLGSNSIDIRLGGIYSLESVARDSPSDRGVVFEVLSAYVRTHSPAGPVCEQSLSTPDGAQPRRLEVDIQAAVGVIGRGAAEPDNGQSPERVDLSSTCLGGAILRDAYLFGAILESAELPKANLHNADLTEANLTGVNLNGASLNSAVLDSANLDDASLLGHATDLTSASLSRADLSNAILTDANLPLAILTEANLRLATLTRANAHSVNLTRAQLPGADLTGANLSGANLENAVLPGANLTEVDLAVIDVRDVDVPGIDLPGTPAPRANLTDAVLSGANLTRADLSNANMSGANLLGANLTGANLSGADLTNAVLNHADLEDVYYEDTDWPEGFAPPPSRDSPMPAENAAAETSPHPPACTAAALADVSSGVSAVTSAYLYTHPEVNEVLTNLGGPPEDQIEKGVAFYIEANPEIASELSDIRRPLVEFRNRCG